MNYSKVSQNKLLIRLKQGERVNESIKKFANMQNIANAAFFAIGSIENPRLAHYRVDSKKYSEKNIKGIFEVASLIGNIGLFENEPLIHSHIVISDENMQALAGHLVDATVSATLEIILFKFNSRISKSFNAEIGLKLYDLKEEY